MTQRERNLAVIVAALLLGWVGWSAWGSYQSAYQRRERARANAAEALDQAKYARKQVRKAALEQLADYQERSLPADPQIAQQDYRAWLVDQLEAAGLDFDDVTLTDRRPSGEAYTSLGYSATAQGSLAAVTRFLHTFYDTPLLHKLTLLKLNPLDEGGLQVNFNVRALAVNGATRKSGVPGAGSGRPLLGGVDTYLTSITERDVFARYVPPPPPRPPRPPVVKRDPLPPKPKFDDAAHAYVTALVGSGDRWQAWINVRTTGDTLRLSPGDELKVGLLTGRVESVTNKKLVYSTGDERFETPLGSHLRNSKKLDEDAVF